jgi:hypothetical protein
VVLNFLVWGGDAELVQPGLERLWYPRISGMGKETWPAPHRTFGGSHRTGSPVLVGSASILVYVSVDGSRHGCFGAGEEGEGEIMICWNYSENWVHRGS